MPTCFMLEVQFTFHALRLAAASAGSSIAARIAMMAMTTRSSMSVNPLRAGWFFNFINNSRGEKWREQIRLSRPLTLPSRLDHAEEHVRLAGVHSDADVGDANRTITGIVEPETGGRRAP